MTKSNLWWNIINSTALLILYFAILFSYGKIPMMEQKITELENRIDKIDYHLQCPNKDTIVINNYYQIPLKK